jgi:hypothetical protein
LIPQTIQRRPIAGGRGFGSAPLSKEGTFALLGANPYHRMMQTCQTVFHVPPFPAPQSAKEAYANLLETFKSVVPRKDPHCCTNGNDIQYEWANSKARNNPLKACAFQMLWEAIAVALSAGFACFFFFYLRSTECRSGSKPVIREWLLAFSGAACAEFCNNFPGPQMGGCDALYNEIVRAIFPLSGMSQKGFGEKRELAMSNSSTI